MILRVFLAFTTALLAVAGCQLFGGGEDGAAREGMLELKIDLPQAASGVQGMETVLGVAIAADGKLYVNGVETNEPALEKFAQEERGENPKLRATIMADKDVRYQKVVEIIDILKRAGIDEVSLGVEPRAPVPISGRATCAGSAGWTAGCG
jgi:biopolymer transport protein ExbD